MSRFTAEEDLRLYRKLALELGPTVRAALEDDLVVEVVVNADGVVRVERLGLGFAETEERFSRERAISLLETIATMQDASVDRRNPILESWIPGYGARIEGVLPPVSWFPVFAIRKHAKRVYTLAEYVQKERMSVRARDVLCEAVDAKDNILVAGGTGTGKTTLINALLREIEERSPSVRCAILEDTRELLTTSPYHVQLETDSYDTDLRRLLRTALRLRPDRIIVGETRGGEAQHLIEAWGTGHPGGISSLHADSAEGALRRLEQLAGHGSLGVVRSDIAATVGLVVFLKRGPNGPRVQSVVRVRGWDADGYALDEVAGDERRHAA